MLQARPFLRWAGSKKHLLRVLERYWRPEFSRYIEPFMGSASLFFSIDPECAVLGDLNPELVVTFEQVKERPVEVADALGALETRRSVYDEWAAADPSSLRPVQRAARLIYLMRFCWGGVYRTNGEGRYNVPWAGRKTGCLPDREELVRASEVLGAAKIMEDDFSVTIADAGTGDFVYMDPPYASSGSASSNQYGAEAFSRADLPRLAGELERLDKAGASFVVSYRKCEEAIEVFDGWFMVEKRVRRRIKQGYDIELIVSDSPPMGGDQLHMDELVK